jgi:hypothetical protein
VLSVARVEGVDESVSQSGRRLDISRAWRWYVLGPARVVGEERRGVGGDGGSAYYAHFTSGGWFLKPLSPIPLKVRAFARATLVVGTTFFQSIPTSLPPLQLLPLRLQTRRHNRHAPPQRADKRIMLQQRLDLRLRIDTQHYTRIRQARLPVDDGSELCAPRRGPRGEQRRRVRGAVR